MDTDDQVMALTTAEAVALVKRAERERARICLHVRFDALVVDKPEHVYPDACAHFVELSRKDALELVSNALSATMEAKGARIPMSRSVRPGHEGDRPSVIYWIG